jgi:hypothetical protein
MGATQIWVRSAPCSACNDLSEGRGWWSSRGLASGRKLPRSCRGRSAARGGGGHAPKAYRPRHPEALQALTEKGSRRAFAVRRGGLADRGPAAPSAGRAGAKSLSISVSPSLVVLPILTPRRSPCQSRTGTLLSARADTSMRRLIRRLEEPYLRIDPPHLRAIAGSKFMA